MNSSEVVIFGAGNIGRGLMGQLVACAGRRPIFVEADKQLARQLRDAGRYQVRLVGREESSYEISNYQVLTLDDQTDITDAITSCDFAVTSVGGQHLASVASLMQSGLVKRKRPLNIMLCENWPKADVVMAEAISRLDVPADLYSCIPCSVERMVRRCESSLDLLGESNESVLLDRSKWAGDAPDIEGSVLCDDLKPFYARKIFTNNAGHVLLAYMGFLSNCEFLCQALKVDAILMALNELLLVSIKALAMEYNMDQVALQSHIECLVNYRFANEKLADSVIRVALQPLRKLDPKERMVGLIRLLQKHNLPTAPVSRIIGAALHYFDPEDAQCIQMKEMISVSGPGVVLKEICKITEKERCFNECLEFYQEFTS